MRGLRGNRGDFGLRLEFFFDAELCLDRPLEYVPAMSAEKLFNFRQSSDQKCLQYWKVLSPLQRLQFLRKRVFIALVKSRLLQ